MGTQIQDTLTRAYVAEFSGGMTIPAAVVWQVHVALAHAKGELSNYAKTLGVKPEALTTYQLCAAGYEALAKAREATP